MARRSSSRSTGSWLALFSFIAVMLLGLALVLSFVFGLFVGMGGVVGYIERVALGIAICIPLVLSYHEARRKSQTWFILWVVATVLVVVFYILGWIPWRSL